jgi:hypothetical protein
MKTSEQIKSRKRAKRQKLAAQKPKESTDYKIKERSHEAPVPATFNYSKGKRILEKF